MAAPAVARGKVLVVFDFDQTILDCDSDDWVIENMGLGDLFTELLPLMSFNSLMDKLMEELWKRGKRVEDIADCLKKAPLHPNMISAIKSAYASGCELRILSDANMFFIETILKHHGIRDCFSEIITNPTYVDEQGRLRILPYRDDSVISHHHGCNMCPPNLCKGVIVRSIQADPLIDGSDHRRIYIGDGKNDYCPSVKLSEKDYVMPRKNYPFWDLIMANPKLVQASVHEWTDGVELERVLLKLIGLEQMVAAREQLIAPDSKCQRSEAAAASSSGITESSITTNVVLQVRQ